MGIAKKADKLKCGDDAVFAAADSGKARLIITAADASPGTVRKARLYLPPGTVLISLPFTKRELGNAAGTRETALAAVTDHGMAAAFVKKLSEEFPGRYDEELEKLAKKAEKVLRRRKESAAEKKNRDPGGKNAFRGETAKEERK